jgi:hypothetical protein
MSADKTLQCFCYCVLLRVWYISIDILHVLVYGFKIGHDCVFPLIRLCSASSSLTLNMRERMTNLL